MLQNFLELLGSYPKALVFRPAEQPISVKQESIAGLKSDQCFSECRSFDQAQRRRYRSDGFCCAVVTNNQKRRVAWAHDPVLPRCRMKPNTQPGPNRERAQER